MRPLMTGKLRDAATLIADKVEHPFDVPDLLRQAASTIDELRDRRVQRGMTSEEWRAAARELITGRRPQDKEQIDRMLDVELFEVLSVLMGVVPACRTGDALSMGRLHIYGEK